MNCNDWLQKTRENSYCFILSKENLLAHCILATGFVARVAPIVRPINSKSSKLVAICHFIFKIYQRIPETLWIFIYKRMAIFIATENENEVYVSFERWDRMILTKIEQMFMILIHRMAKQMFTVFIHRMSREHLVARGKNTVHMQPYTS